MFAAFAAHGERLPTEVFSARAGLPTTVIDRVVADSKGFVWMPTATEGLARFDGNGFRIFTGADGLPAGTVFDIFERKDGSYWVTVEDQLCMMDARPGRRRFSCESLQPPTAAQSPHFPLRGIRRGSHFRICLVSRAL